MAILATAATIGSTVWNQRDTIADFAGQITGGGDDTRDTICPGGRPTSEVRAAMQNSPSDELDQMRRMVQARHDNSFTPLGVSQIMSGGNDCNFNTEWGRQDASRLRQWVDRWSGGAQESPAWSPGTPDQIQAAPAADTQHAPDFAAPGAALMGLPIWAWLLIGIAIFLVATGRV